MQWIGLEEIEGITVVTLQRKEKINALHTPLFEELLEVFSANHQALLLLGEGEKGFCAGADLSEFQKGKKEVDAYLSLANLVMDTFANALYPTVCLVHGYALGGGLELALCADQLFATHNALLGFPETTKSLIPGFGGCFRLQERIGMAQAKGMIFSGRTVPADEAFKLGLVEGVFKQEFAKDYILQYFARMDNLFAVQQAKRAFVERSDREPFLLCHQRKLETK